MDATPSVRLKKGREKSVLEGHPWVFSGALSAVSGEPEPGDVVRVTDARGGFLAYGHFSPGSQIRLRLLSWREEEAIDEGWWRRRLDQAASLRRRLFAATAGSAYRLIHAEADLLPGLIVDRYGDFFVLQALSAGAEKNKPLIARLLGEMFAPRGIYERGDSESREIEGLKTTRGVLFGEPPPAELTIVEGGRRFVVDLISGQKTGFYLDQRANREEVAGWVEGCEVLDCFSYTGGFAIWSLARGATRVACAESSAPALELLQKNLAANGFAPGTVELLQGNAFETLRQMRDRGRSFDVIILDPPKLAPTRAHAAKAARAYKDINLLALKLLRPGGILATFSCSAGIEPAHFRQIVLWASRDARREVQILRHLSQPPDHPIRISFPESEYLKGLICRVL